MTAESIAPFNWKMYDHDLEFRQITVEGDSNVWQFRRIGFPTTFLALDDILYARVNAGENSIFAPLYE